MNNEQVKELSGIALEVKGILEQYPQTRDNNWDTFIYYVMYKEDFYSYNIPLSVLMKYPFESITRAKRKVQELYPELRGEKRKERERRQEIFIEFNTKNKKELEEFWEAEVELEQDIIKADDLTDCEIVEWMKDAN